MTGSPSILGFLGGNDFCGPNLHAPPNEFQEAEFYLKGDWPKARIARTTPESSVSSPDLQGIMPKTLEPSTQTLNPTS